VRAAVAAISNVSGEDDLSSQFRWVIAGVLVGALFMWFSLRGTDAGSVLEGLSRTHGESAIAVIVAAALFMFVKAIRWKVILQPAGSPGLNSLHSAVYIGTAANLVIAHSGELLRAALIGRKESIPQSAILASVGIERVFDFIVVAAMLGLLLLFDQRMHESTAAAGMVAVAAVAVGLALMMILVRPSRLRSALSDLLSRIIPPAAMGYVSDQLRRSIVGLSVLASPWLLLQVFLLSLLQWGFIVAAIWLSAAAVGQSITVSMAITVWVLMIVGLTLPSSPAQLGTTQLAFTLGLAFSDTGDQAAFAASVIYTLGVNGTYMAVGLACWLLFGKWHLGRTPSSASR
jgi:uncharacterized protein (TIRG00374 family)